MIRMEMSLKPGAISASYRRVVADACAADACAANAGAVARANTRAALESA